MTRQEEMAAPAGRKPPGEVRPSPRTFDPVVWLIALAVFAAYAILSLSRYFLFNPGSWDLGIFTEYVKQLAHFRAPIVDIRGQNFNLFGDHFQPIVGLLAPFFRVFPTPATLLIAQALLTAVSVFPVCRAARERLGTGASRVIGVAYGFSWGLQEMVNFDFHEVAFAVPLLAFSLSALVRRRPWAAVLWGMPLVFVKEDQGFTLAAIGLLMVAAAAVAGRDDVPGAGLVGDSEPAPWAWGGALLAVWGLAWSMFAIIVVVPHFSPTHSYPYWYDGGVVGPNTHFSVAGVLHQLTNGGSEKFATTIAILAPAAFLGLRSPLILAAVPSLALRFLSTNNYFWSTGWHYNATVMPIVFVAAIDGMARFQARSQERSRQTGLGRGGWTGPGAPLRWRLPRPGILIARYGAYLMLPFGVWLALQHPLQNLWNAQTYEITPHVRAEAAAVARVPPGTTVEATLSMLAPLAARDATYWIGTGGNPAPKYIVFDSLNSGWSPAPTDVPAFVDQRHPGVTYRQIYLNNGVYVFRSQGSTGG